MSRGWWSPSGAGCAPQPARSASVRTRSANRHCKAARVFRRRRARRASRSLADHPPPSSPPLAQRLLAREKGGSRRPLFRSPRVRRVRRPPAALGRGGEGVGGVVRARVVLPPAAERGALRSDRAARCGTATTLARSPARCRTPTARRVAAAGTRASGRRRPRARVGEPAASSRRTHVTVTFLLVLK